VAPAAQRPVTWRREALHLARSGSTLALNQLLQLVVPFVTTTMTGRLGIDALAAGGIVGSIGLLLFVTALGVMQGLVPPLSTSAVTKDHVAAARTIRGGLAVALAMGLAATSIMASVPWCLARAGQDPTVVAVAQDFIHALLPGYLPSIVAIAFRFFLIATHDLKWLNAIVVAGTAFNIACNLLLARGPFQIDGMTAIGITVALTNWLTLALLTIAIWRSRIIPLDVLDWRSGFALHDALKLGIPVGAIFFTETLLFTGSSVLMGYFGTVALAAHGVVLLWLNIALMVPIGLSQAAMTRVASLLGERDFAAARQSMIVSLFAGCATSLATGALLLASSDSLVHLTIWSRSEAGEEMVEVARGFFRFCAITQLLSGLLIVMASLLRGLRDANAVLWLVALIYWGVGLGGAVLFAFTLGLGGTGIWVGITLAFALSAALLAVRFWRALSRIKQSRSPRTLPVS
jgi:multidrug resistance protein, MATE family